MVLALNPTAALANKFQSFPSCERTQITGATVLLAIHSLCKVVTEKLKISGRNLVSLGEMTVRIRLSQHAAFVRTGCSGDTFLR